MPEGDRPRERLKQRGATALADAELIAILLRTGVKGKSAVQLAQELLREHGNSLDQLVCVPLEAIAKVKGIGETKAIQVKAAFELARRVSERPREKQPVIGAQAEAAAALRADRKRTRLN